jgi:bifunctional DNA-binding transcriptional regulator/antitoxin component of YhaV-PrlF toxin-antitoxin module
MCDANTSSVLENIVRQKVAAREMFTAFDVSRTAQQSHGVRERHRNMGNEIHRIFSQGVMDDYLRETIALPGVPVNPWLYYPPENNPADYVSPHTGQSPTHVGNNPVGQVVTQAPSPAAVATAVDDDDEDEDDAPQDDDDLPKADKRGRCWVPVKFVAALNLKPGDVAYVVRTTVQGEPGLQLKQRLDPSDTEAVAYKVDRNNNVAISKGCLEEAGIDAPTGTAFEIAVDQSVVSVRLAPATVGVN